MSGYAPEDTLTLSQVIDTEAPESTITAQRIPDTSDFNITWNVRGRSGRFGREARHPVCRRERRRFPHLAADTANAVGSAIFEGEAGKTYEFLALATDVAGNREVPRPGVNAVDDGSAVNLGGLPSVPGTTAPNFGQPPAPSPEPSTNALFLAALANVPAADPLTRSSEFDKVLSPFVANAFATGIGQSDGGIGPMAIVEAPNGDILVSGGPNRGSIWRFDRRGGVAGEALAVLDVPIFNMAFDLEGRLWATTGGGALVRLDPVTGQILDRFADGVTIALAIDPDDGTIYVLTNNGISVFDPDDGSLTQWSRDENLRVGSLAFDNDGELWAVTWPDRRQVVKFTDRARAETMLTFDAPADLLAFGQAGTALEGLLFVSHTSGDIGDNGIATVGSELTMVDLATLRRVAVADSGSRGDVVFATSEGRLLISQSNQVDLVAPATAPEVIATNPPPGAQVALPQPFLSVTFDQDMFVGAANAAGSVLNPEYYTLTGETGGILRPQSVTYDAATRTVFLAFGAILPDSYTLTAAAALTSQFGQRMGVNYASNFEAFDDISTLVDLHFSNTRYDRATGTISYDVVVTNRTDGPITLPALLTIDPLAGFDNVPVDAVGQSEDGRWLIDLSSALPAAEFWKAVSRPLDGRLLLPPAAGSACLSCPALSPEPCPIPRQHSPARRRPLRKWGRLSFIRRPPPMLRGRTWSSTC